jgi:hypothetical protein
VDPGLLSNLPPERRQVRIEQLDEEMRERTVRIAVA